MPYRRIGMVASRVPWLSFKWAATLMRQGWGSTTEG